MPKSNPAALGLAAERSQREQTGHMPSRIPCGAVLRLQTSLTPQPSRQPSPQTSPNWGPSDWGNLALHIWSLLSLIALGRPQILEPDFRWKTENFGGISPFFKNARATHTRVHIVFSLRCFWAIFMRSKFAGGDFQNLENSILSNLARKFWPRPSKKGEPNKNRRPLFTFP